ncbi:MAG: non-canonical purine NTP pyrophosphatase, RdgB/HAM1 family [Zetaproteobacteria bacterium CG2_30_46_52]|nr:MAG: non-canonical purine NTP pyrophosphatase, RdgB/HAM1 family [Zetaproteobacteria bacterium CG2_30_46_52]
MALAFSKLVIASNNAKKRAEIAAILGGLGIEVAPISETVSVDVVEDGLTFAENAKKKADAFMRTNQLPALADDSGLCVDALAGAPGIYSARFAGEEASDTDNNRKLLEVLQGNTKRSARFVCAIHLALPNGQQYAAEGSVEGHILETLDGDSGFGYDPLFFAQELNKSFAQASPEEKTTVSHRGHALRQLKSQLEASKLTSGTQLPNLE